MAGNEVDLREKHALQRVQRVVSLFGGTAQHAHQAVAHPLHDRQPDRVLAEKMAEHRALRHPHRLRHVLRGDVVDALFGGEFQRHADDFLAPLVSAQPFALGLVGLGFAGHGLAPLDSD